MTWWAWLLIVIGVIVLLGVLISLPDLRRYMRIRAM